jgi:alpha-glucosidase (family GH31 glycosyl hydrolase)
MVGVSRFFNRAAICISSIFVGAAFAQWTPIGNYVAPYSVAGNKVTFTCTNGKVQVECCRPDMVRIRMVKGSDAFLADEPFMIQKYDWAALNPTITTVGTQIKIATAEVVVGVETAPLRIIFYKPDGTIITQQYSTNTMGWDAATGRGCYMNLGATEHFFGFGVQFHTFDWRGSAADIWTSDQGNHYPIPFFMSTAGYGMLLHNPFHSTFSMGSTSTNYYSFTVLNGELDFYFLYGPQFKKMQGAMADLVGHMWMPPKYAITPFYRTMTTSASSVLSVAQGFRDNDIPCENMGLEPGWQSGAYPSTLVWSSSAFPNPKNFIDSMTAKGFKVNLWEESFIGSGCPIYASLGSYLSNCLAFNGKIPDFTVAAARDLWWNYHNTTFISNGIVGFKCDENDQFCDPTCTWPTGMTGYQFHNMWGMLQGYATHQGMRTVGKRSFFFSRGNFLGSQRYTNCAYSDVYDLSYYVRATVNSGFSGALWTPEVRRNDESNNDLFQRRLQLTAFSACFNDNEWQSTTDAPWLLGATLAAAHRLYSKLRFSLVPYIYSCYRVHNQTGVPLVRPLPLEYQSDTMTYNKEDEYCFGDFFLVAPVQQQGTVSRSVYLPEGTWYDYWQENKYTGKQTISFSTAPLQLPLFIKAGAIIPRQPDMSYTGQKVCDPLIVDVFPATTASTFTLYEDAGDGYNYENGDYCETKYDAIGSTTGSSFTVNARVKPGAYTPASRSYLLRIRAASATTVKKDNVAMAMLSDTTAVTNSTTGGWAFANGKAFVKFPDNGAATVITIDNPPTGVRLPATNNALRKMNFCVISSSNEKIAVKLDGAVGMKVQCRLYTMLGRMVGSSVNQTTTVQSSTLVVTPASGNSFAKSGIYLLTVTAGDTRISKVVKL